MFVRHALSRNLRHVFLLGYGEWPVPDRSDEFRKAARECLELARKTTNVSTRAALLTMAQRSLDLASGSAADDQLKALLRELNDQKMRVRTKPPQLVAPPIGKCATSAPCSSVTITAKPIVVPVPRKDASRRRPCCPPQRLLPCC
jgi:hypothetical protein